LHKPLAPALVALCVALYVLFGAWPALALDPIDLSTTLHLPRVVAAASALR